MAFASPVNKWGAYIFLLLAPLLTRAQDDCIYEVTGTVLDLETNNPLPYVAIAIRGSSKGTITDDEGKFFIQNICLKEFDLVITHVGYKSTVHHHDAYHESPIILLAPDNQLLESVVVEGEYNPVRLQTIRVEKLSADVLNASRTASLGVLAGKMSGVSTIQTGQNIVKPMIHGLHSNRVLIINNGVRHEFQNWGIEHAPEIDPSMASSIQVVKGAATVRYGPDALGGVILVDPVQQMLSAGLNGKVGISGDSNGKAGDASISIQHGWEHLAISGQAAMIRQGDLHTPDYQLTNTGKSERSFSGAIRYHKRAFDLSGYYSYFHQNLGILRGSVNESLADLSNAMSRPVPFGTEAFSYDIQNPRQETSHHLAKLHGSYVFDNHDLSFQYAYQLNHRQEFDLRRGSNLEIPSIDLELASHSVDIDWNHPDLGHIEGTTGIQWMYQDNDNKPGTNTAPFVPNYRMMRFGIFAIERINVNDHIFEAGMRYDYQYTFLIGREQDNSIYQNTLTFNQVTGSLGYLYEYGDQSFRSNIGLAWRPPNVSELYSFGKHQSSIIYGLWRYQQNQENTISTESVLSGSEKPIQAETGIKWINTYQLQNGSNQFEVTAYANLIRNYIFNRPYGITNTIRGAFPFFIYDQTNALFVGFDIAFEQSLIKRWFMSGKASMVWARDMVNQDVLIEIPPARMDLRLTYKDDSDLLSKSDFTVEGTYTFRSFQSPRIVSVGQILEAQESNENLFAEDHSIFDFRAPPDGYFLTNVAWSAGIKRIRWIISINNVFNTSYRSYTDRLRYFADATGRNFQLKLEYVF